jgi:AraC-like DNA-binding protein
MMKARADAAARLLQNSNRSMSDTALQAGFFDQSRLSRVFRRVTGMTPGQYRQIIREWH